MQISGSTTLLALIGHPIAHTLSPAMHNAAAAALDIDMVYLPFDVPPHHLANAVRGLAALGVRGANVTVPHKEVIVPHLGVLDPAAQACGAVNTLLFETVGKQRRIVGCNTDWSGFSADLRECGVDVRGRECVVLGAGGSARAVAYALLREGARIHLMARREEQAGVLSADLHARPDQIRIHPWEPERISRLRLDAPLIVNTTPLGMAPHPGHSPWPDTLPLPHGAFVYDLVYNPAETRFMQQARAQGCRTANGLGMLLHQAAHAFHLWTGRQPDLGVMRAALDAAVV